MVRNLLLIFSYPVGKIAKKNSLKECVFGDFAHWVSEYYFEKTDMLIFERIFDSSLRTLQKCASNLKIPAMIKVSFT